ncbi:MAG: type I-U CRISPR-associated helicase/endonuclease Cas3 [Mycobacteriales bacterium]
MTLQAGGFPDFFFAVHGLAPFAWQVELASLVIKTGRWPAALDVPTGMGKTAVLDIAVFALACQARDPERTAPTRTFLVVDRRVIVDQAHERAQRIADAIAGSSTGVLAEVGAALRNLAGEQGPPLATVRMRGGSTWASRWLSSACTPAIVTGTVDQLGSRLLFRGYGVSDGMKPINAALCGKDSLLLLDEAHLSQPFLRTVTAVRSYEALAVEPVLGARRPRAVLLSATLSKPSDGSLDDVFACDPEAETSPVAQARLHAVKRTRLLDVKARGDLAPVLDDLARHALATGAERVAVICNTVALARSVFEGLKTVTDKVDRALLIGRCRGVERDANADMWVRGRLAATQLRDPARPLVVVATQTVEVGADMDVDALITEACPLDALTQRLGRLNRLGRAISADAVIVWDASVHGQQEQTLVYGSATGRTWDWLVERAGPVTQTTPAKVLATLPRAPILDLGVRGELARLTPGERANLATASPLAPVVLSPILDIWSRTSPIPVPDQPVAPFLHGLTPPRAEVSVCWRAGLSGREAWEEELALVPPGAHELVTVSYVEARRVLLRLSGSSTQSDSEGGLEEEDPFDEAPTVQGWVLRGDGKIVPLTQPALRPGAIVVLDSESGGHDAWGWTGRLEDGKVADVADPGERGPWRLRLRPGLWNHVLASSHDAWQVLGDPDHDRRELQDLVRTLHGHAEPGPLRTLLGHFAGPERWGPEVRQRWVSGGIILTRPRSGPDDVHGGLTDGADDRAGLVPGSSSVARTPIGLHRHLRDVGGRARMEALGLGLPADLVHALTVAGLAHDLGKADPRFQLVLHGGDRYRRELAPELLAKSPVATSSQAERSSIARLSGRPRGMRHESISATALLRLQILHPELLAGIDAELVLHLVASHHGHARPLLPAVVDTEPVDVEAGLPALDPDVAPLLASVRSDEGVVDWDHPGRYARLCARYGRWGLALLETVLRLADMAESEAYDREVPS